MSTQTRIAALVLAAGFASAATAFETSTSWEDGLAIDWGQKRSIEIGSRFHYDFASFDDDVTRFEDDSDFRRARVIVRGRYEDWRARADYDFGLIEGWRSLYVQYRGFDRQRITVGHQVAPFSLDDVVGSNDFTFLERSLASALAPGMLLGVSWRTWGDDWTLNAGVFGNELNDQDRRNIDGTSAIARFTYAPIRKKRRVLHFGVAQELRSVDGGELVRVRTRPESRIANDRLVSTPRLEGIDDVATTGLELLGIRDNLKFQSEYMLMSMNGGPNAADFSGVYAQVSWVVTGERYRYSRSRGLPTAIRPKHRLGALELAARYSTVDLTDGAVTGGEQTQWTAGVSWYLNRQLRVMLNYSRYDADPNQDGIAEDGSIVMLRFQASM
jgi:phosphate-selective porin OprO/OprP